MPCSANGAGGSRGFWPQTSSPRPGLGACVRKINKYKRKTTSFGQNQGLAWSSDSSLWGNQVLKRKTTSFGQNQGLAWSSDSSLWGNQLLKRKHTSFGQNQSLAWPSDSSLWGNQLLNRKTTSYGHDLDVIWPLESIRGESPIDSWANP